MVRKKTFPQRFSPLLDENDAATIHAGQDGVANGHFDGPIDAPRPGHVEEYRPAVDQIMSPSKSDNIQDSGEDAVETDDRASSPVFYSKLRLVNASRAVESLEQPSPLLASAKEAERKTRPECAPGSEKIQGPVTSDNEKDGQIVAALNSNEDPRHAFDETSEQNDDASLACKENTPTIKSKASSGAKRKSSTPKSCLLVVSNHSPSALRSERAHNQPRSMKKALQSESEVLTKSGLKNKPLSKNGMTDKSLVDPNQHKNKTPRVARIKRESARFASLNVARPMFARGEGQRKGVSPGGGVISDKLACGPPARFAEGAAPRATYEGLQALPVKLDADEDGDNKEALWMMGLSPDAFIGRRITQERLRNKKKRRLADNRLLKTEVDITMKPFGHDFPISLLDKYLVTELKLVRTQASNGSLVHTWSQKCPFCDKYLYSLQEHVKKQHQEFDYKSIMTVCPIENCGRTVKDFANHIRFKHNKTRTKVCNICFRVFPTKTGLDFHVNRAHTSVKKVKCPICQEELLPFSLKSHNQRKHPEVKVKLVCPEEGCESIFGYKGDLKRHLDLVHKKLKVGCPHCDRQLHPHLLKSHIIYQHTKDFPYRCKPCDKGFMTKNGLDLHETDCHIGIFMVCKMRKSANEMTCNRVIHTENALITHMEEYHMASNDITICAHCVSPVYRSYFTHHAHKMHTSNKTICCVSDCKVMLKKGVSQYDHVKKDHPELLKNLDWCTICDIPTFNPTLHNEHFHLSKRELDAEFSPVTGLLRGIKCSLCPHYTINLKAMKRHICLEHSSSDRNKQIRRNDQAGHDNRNLSSKTSRLPQRHMHQEHSSLDRNKQMHTNDQADHDKRNSSSIANRLPQSKNRVKKRKLREKWFLNDIFLLQPAPTTGNNSDSEAAVGNNGHGEADGAMVINNGNSQQRLSPNESKFAANNNDRFVKVRRAGGRVKTGRQKRRQ